MVNYTLRSDDPSFHIDVFMQAIEFGGTLDGRVKFENALFPLSKNIENIDEVYRDVILEGPTAKNRGIEPFLEQEWVVKGNKLRIQRAKHKVPKGTKRNVKAMYTNRIHGGLPQWHVVKADRAEPSYFQEAVEFLCNPAKWVIQEAELMSRTKGGFNTLLFGTNRKGLEASVLGDCGPFEEWLDKLANQYSIETEISRPGSYGAILPQTSYKRMLLEGRRYAIGVQALRESFEKGEHLLKRPLTFAENLQAKLQNPSLFRSNLASCTAIAYEKNSKRFKIIPKCDLLINIPPTFKQQFRRYNYHKLDGEEFSASDSRLTFNKPLTPSAVLRHPVWRAAAEDDNLLREFVSRNFEFHNEFRYDDRTGMQFKILDNSGVNMVFALWVDCSGSARGDIHLGGNQVYSCGDAFFARLAPSGAP